MANVDSPDWLNVNPSGSGVVFPSNLQAIGNGATFNQGPAYVGGLDALLVQALTVGSYNLNMAIQFSADAAGLVPLGAGITWSKNSTQASLVPIGIQGAYVNVSAHNVSGAGQQLNISAYGSASGSAGAPLFPPRVVIDQDNIAVGAGSQNQYVPNIQIPGRYHLWCISSVAGGFATIQRWQGAQWLNIAEVQMGATVDANLDFAWPVDDCRLQITNPGAAATVSVKVIGPY